MVLKMMEYYLDFFKGEDIMQILYGHDFNINAPTAVAIGKFDGLHKGHLQVIDKLVHVSKKLGLNSVVYTFNINPKVVLNSDKFKPLMSNREKSEVLDKLGIDYLIYEDFNEDFAKTLPEEFVKKILVNRLNVRTIIMGENSTFGKDGNGNAELMKLLGIKYGFDVEVVKLIRENGEIISSTMLRNNLMIS